jgi:hypothetical protein
MIASLWLIASTEVNPRFYRSHYLVALGLQALAAMAAGSVLRDSSWWALGAAMFLAGLGSIIWSIQGNPGSRIVGITSPVALATVLGLRVAGAAGELSPLDFTFILLGELTSAALLGAAVTAMLLGHFYLIAPGMSLTPLMRLLTALFVATGLRMLLAGWGLWSWTTDHSLINWEDETVLWLPVRWGLGFGGPLVLGWMARSAAKIRSTQSATGILYVVVVFAILGELTSQLLVANTGYML